MDSRKMAARLPMDIQGDLLPGKPLKAVGAEADHLRGLGASPGNASGHGLLFSRGHCIKKIENFL